MAEVLPFPTLSRRVPAESSPPDKSGAFDGPSSGGSEPLADEHRRARIGRRIELLPADSLAELEHLLGALERRCTLGGGR